MVATKTFSFNLFKYLQEHAMFFYTALQIRSLDVQSYFTMNCKACYRTGEYRNATESGIRRKKCRYIKDYLIFIVCIIKSIHTGHAFEFQSINQSS